MVKKFMAGLAVFLATWAACSHLGRLLPPGKLVGGNTETYYTQAIAQAHGWQAEITTPAGTRCDIVVPGQFAIEVDWAGKWAECYGQAVHYGDELGLEPVMLFLTGKGESPADIERGALLGQRHGVQVWYYNVQTSKLKRD